MRKGKNKSGLIIVIALMVLALYTCGNNVSSNKDTSTPQTQTVESTPTPAVTTEPTDTPAPTEEPDPSADPTPAAEKESSTYEYEGKSYTIIEVDGGDLSGDRLPNVAVDVGYGDRVYWALTNEYGQLIHVIADKVTLQDSENEPVLSTGRYYSDEAKVSGTEESNLDEGHVIADSLGGVSNAYNITPQNSTLNRHGDQAYMEKVLRDAGGCEKFIATITYPDEKTQIPSHYNYEYVLKGNKVVDDFDNVNPDEANRTINETAGTNSGSNEAEEMISNSDNGNEDLSSIDTNGNGKVTIAEAKAAGYKMPIYKDHWLYKYMDDRDGDGMVGE